MLAKIVGILLIVIGGSIALGVLFDLVESIFELLWILIKLVVPLVIAYVGYRLLTRDSRY